MSQLDGGRIFFTLLDSGINNKYYGLEEGFDGDGDLVKLLRVIYEVRDHINSLGYDTFASNQVVKVISQCL